MTATLPKMKVVIGYDGSEYAEAAIEDLRRAGLPADVHALVVSVADVYPHLPPEAYTMAGEPAPAREARYPMQRRLRALATEAKSEADELAARGAERVRNRYPSWTVDQVALADSPYRAIVTKAEEWKPDLVVVGSHGRSAAGRAVLGSVSQQVLHHAPCSVRVARRPDDISRLAEEPPKLVVGIDGSPDAAAAISAVAMRPWPKGTRVQVIVAVDLRAATALMALGPPEGAYASLVPAASDEKAWAHEAAENAAQELRDNGLAAAPLVLPGDPKRVLVDVAQRWGADCIFVGAKGHSRLERFLLGSVSSAVAARANCSVEVVRQGR